MHGLIDYLCNKDKTLTGFLFLLLGTLLSGLYRAIKEVFLGMLPRLNETGSIIGTKLNDWIRKK